MIEDVELHKYRSQWTLMKNVEIKYKQKNKGGKLNFFLFIWSLKCNIFPDVGSFKYKFRLCANGKLKQWGVN